MEIKDISSNTSRAQKKSYKKRFVWTEDEYIREAKKLAKKLERKDSEFFFASLYCHTAFLSVLCSSYNGMAAYGKRLWEPPTHGGRNDG